MCVHAKSFVVDDEIAWIGSFNLDPRSVHLNTEVGIVFWDEALARSIKENILADERYTFLFSVEEVNKLVLSGVPFRDAYKQVGIDIEQGRFSPSRNIQHTHEGSIGNLCNADIQRMMKQVVANFAFEKAEKAIQQLTQA